MPKETLIPKIRPEKGIPMLGAVLGYIWLVLYWFVTLPLRACGLLTWYPMWAMEAQEKLGIDENDDGGSYFWEDLA